MNDGTKNENSSLFRMTKDEIPFGNLNLIEYEQRENYDVIMLQNCEKET